MLLLLVRPNCAIAQGKRVESQATTAASLLAMLRTRLREVNPIIEHVAIVEVRAPWPEDRRRAVLAWGVRKDRVFSGRYEDELFGVFVMNDSLTRVLRTLEIMPTRRWLDYEWYIAKINMDSVFLSGRGATYGDAPLKKAHSW